MKRDEYEGGFFDALFESLKATLTFVSKEMRDEIIERLNKWAKEKV